MKRISVSQKIKILGLLLILSIFSVISISIYLNQQNIKDATIINIAGKQRMLTQKITKNIFYLSQTKKHDFKEIDDSIKEFNDALEILKNGNEILKISPAPTTEISNQILKVTELWKVFEENTKKFESALVHNDIVELTQLIDYIYKTNNILLEEVDGIVTLFTTHFEEKTAFIKNFQFLSFALLFIFALYSLVQLKQIEAHAREFIEKYKKLGNTEISALEPIEINSEKEFIEMADDMNCFISKVNSVVNYSQTALEQSQLASKKLETLTEEFEDIISELENKSEIMKQIDMSEDIAIESSENLLKTTKKLNDLKTQLDALLQNCQTQKH